MEKVNRVHQVGDIKALIQLLNGMKLEPLFEKIKHEIRSGNRDAVSYIKAMFVGSPVVNEKSTKRRLEIFKFCVTLLQISSLQNEIASEMLSILLVEIEVFPTSALVEISEYLVADFKSTKKPEGKWLEILPRALSVLSARDTIVYGGLDMGGKDLKHMLVKSLCDDELNQSAVEMLTVVLKDVELNKDELELVVTKLLSVIPHVSFQEMPTYMYQLILFSSKGYRKKILQNIVSYFITEDNKVRDYESCESESLIPGPNVTLLRQTEGSVILLLKVGSRQDRSLGKDLVAMMKSIQHQPSLCLSPFVFSIALSLVCVQRYEDEVLDILKGVTLRAFKQKEKALGSAWIRNILSNDQDIIALIKEAICNSTFGWDHMGQGLVKFGFLLLDTYGPKQVCGRNPNRIKPHTATISEQICALGCVILRETFKAHRSVRSEIFEQILNRVITKTSAPVTHYIDVLSQTVQSDPQLLLEILSKLIEVLDYLPFLSYKNATDILKALTPLLKISMPLKDTLMLILRKALFHRNLEARKIAITGYMTILKRISAVGKISLSQSQSSLSSQASSCSIGSQVQKDCSFSATSKSESMCLEIMGILKRILMQQAEVKRLLYEGLYDVAVKNLSLVDIILELLLSQFEKFHNTTTDGDDSSLNIRSCITTEKDKVILQEPLAHLICAITLILHENKRTPTDDDDMDLDFEQSAQVMLESTLKTLITKMCKSDVELDTLDNFQDLEDSLNEEKFKEHIFLLIGIYEVLMEYSFLSNKNYSVTECEEFLNLFQKYLDTCEKFQRRKTGKSSKNKGAFSMPDTLLTIRFFSVVIEALFTENEEENEGLKLLRSDTDFVKHVTRMCHQKLTLYSETGRSDGFSWYMERTHDYMCTIAKIYLRSYSSGLSSSFPSFRTWELSSVFIKGLSVIFSYMFSSNERQYHKLISELAKFIPSASDNASTRVLKKFQKLTIKALGDCENDEKLKEVVLLLSIISDLCTVPANMVKDEVYQWMKQLTIEQTFEDVPVVKRLVSLCLTLGHQQNDSPQVLREISFDIHYHLGDIEPDTTVRGATNYSVVSAKTSPDLIPVIVQHIEKILEEIDWVLNIMKADAVLSNSPIQIALSHEFGSFNEKEESICALLLDLLIVFKELVQTEIPIGNPSNAIVKVSTNMYKCLTIMCKYYLSRYDQKNGYLHPLFPRVTKHSGMNLNTPVYGFITYIQTKEMESAGNKKKTKSDTAVTVVREIKTIPSLVFAIEVYERHLILLSKKSKKNLMSHIKLSIARDFRIDPSALEAAMNNQENSKETTLDETEMRADEENASLIDPTPSEEVPPTKKRKAT